MDGLRVAEASEYEGVAYCGRLLHSLGAEVVKIEPPGGDPSRLRPPFAYSDAGAPWSLPFEFLNAGKRSVTTGANGLSDEAREVLEAADVVLVTPESWRRLRLEGVPRRPSQLRVRVGVFGGARDEGPSTAFTRFHASGTGYLVPSNTDSAPPAWPGPYAFEAVHGTCVALAVLAELRRDHGGELDYSYQAYGVWMEKMFFNRVVLGQVDDYHRWIMAYTYGGYIECTDGYISVLLVEDHQWRNLCRAMGRDDWVGDERFADGIARARNKHVINSELAAWFKLRTVDEAVHAGAEFDFPIGRVRHLEDVPSLPALQERNFFVAADTRVGRLTVPGLPLGPGFEARTPSAAPHVGDGTEEAVIAARAGRAATDVGWGTRSAVGAPLAGLRILDFTWAAAGPIATSFMAYLGADVVKVEHRSRPDLMRVAGRQYGFGDWDLDSSPSFQEIAAGKRSIELDLRDPADRETAFRLASVADVVIDNMRPGKIEALGLSYEAVSAANPRVVMCSQSATGRTSAPGIPGYAPIFWAEGGGADLTGWPDGPPGAIRGPVDFHAAAHACLGVLALLHERERTGRGGYVDCSAIEAIVSAFGVELLEVATGAVKRRDGNRLPGTLVNDLFPCHGHDEWLAMTIEDEAAWRTFCAAIGLDPDPVPNDASESGRREVYERVAARTVWHDAARLEGGLLGLNVAAVRSMSLANALRDVRLTGRGVWQPIKHDVIGEQVTIGVPWTFNGAPYDLPRMAPRLGEHTEEVLREWLAR